MSRALSPCLDCPTLTDQTRCPRHRTARSRARGSSTARGYGKTHRSLRAEYEQRMAKGETFNCWRCGDPIDVGSAWDLGHDDGDRTVHKGPEHMACNRATSGRM